MFRQFVMTPHNALVALDFNFIVDQANGNGLGIRSLKGQGIKAVYMNTSATPAGPVNPAAGYIYVQLEDSYNRYLYGVNGVVVPSTGAPISISGAGVLTVGIPYIIASVGTSTAANWQAVGLPVGITPAVGVSFFATATGGGTGTGSVVASGVSGIDQIVVVGNPSLTLGFQAPLVGTSAPYLILKCIGATNASTTTQIAVQPAAGSVIGLTAFLSNSSVNPTY
jgi:hypothetical protein